MTIYRRTSCFIPYRKNSEGRIVVFLQKRSKDAARLPGHFGFFGGGIDGNETPEEALIREIREELAYNADGSEYLGVFRENSLHVYYDTAPSDFEEQITVQEGEYGKWFTRDESMAEPLLVDLDKVVLRRFFEKFEQAVPVEL